MSKENKELTVCVHADYTWMMEGMKKIAGYTTRPAVTIPIYDYINILFKCILSIYYMYYFIYYPLTLKVLCLLDEAESVHGALPSRCLERLA